MDGTSLPRSPGFRPEAFRVRPGICPGGLSGNRSSGRSHHVPGAHGLEAPQNYNRAYMGPVSVRQALACSQNIPAMRVLDTFGGPSRLLKLLENLGIRGIQGDAAHYGLGLAIGNAEVTLRDLTGAYACLARGGSFLPLKLEQGASVPERPVLPAEACFMAADILADREARMAAFHDRELMNLPFRYACKTGTSSDFRDNWCVGFTREITVGVWVGNFDASSAASPCPGGMGFPETMPQPASPADYDAVGRAYLDSRYTEWFTSPSCTVGNTFCLLPRAWSGRLPHPGSGRRLAPGAGSGTARRGTQAQTALQPAGGGGVVIPHPDRRAVWRRGLRAAGTGSARHYRAPSGAEPGAAFVNYRQGTVTRSREFSSRAHVEKAFRSVQRQDGGDQHLEPFLRNDGMRHSGGNQESLALRKVDLFIAHGKIRRPVQNRHQGGAGRLVGGEELLVVKKPGWSC